MKVITSQWSVVRKSVFCFAIFATLFALCVVAKAQELKKVPRIGFLTNSSSFSQARIEAFRQGLRELGYVEGKNIVIEWRFGEGKPIGYPGSRPSSCVSR